MQIITTRRLVHLKKVQVGKDQEKAIRKRFPLQKPRWEKKQTNNQVLIP